MNENFTQGEWDWFISDDGDGFPIIYLGDTNIAEVYLPNGNSEQMLSNASLIAAAPEMYRMLSFLQGVVEPGSLSMEIDKLLKKARGVE